jgi:hypothetical protein
VWVLLLGSIVVASFGATGTGTVAAQGPVDPNAFLDLLPALRSAPAPPGVRPGLRITFYSAIASIPGQSHILVPDANGNWVVQSTGQRFSEQGIFGQGGHGYSQVNVAYLDRALAVLDIRSLGLPDPSGGGLSYVQSYSAAVGVPGAGGEYWLHPAALRQAVGMRSPGLAVLRMPYRIGNRQFNGIRIQSVSAGGGQAWVYDEETGVLLYNGSSSVGALPPGPVKQGETPRRGTVMGLNRLVDVRVVSTPWSQSPAPGWVGRLNVVRYTGVQAVTVPGAGTAQIPVAVTLERTSAGAHWARYMQTLVAGGAGGLPANTTQAVRVFGPAQVGGLWIPPSVLAQLTPGRVLDRDPVTRMTTVVGQAGRPDVVMISEGHDGQRLDYGYDRGSGMLVYVGVLEIDPVTGTRTHTQIQLVQR